MNALEWLVPEALALRDTVRVPNLPPRAIFEPRGGEDGTDRVGALSPSWQVGRFAYAICHMLHRIDMHI